MHASEGGKQMSANSYVYENAQEASAACAAKMLDLLQASLAARPVATLAISGGSTPKLLFAELAKERFDWSRIHMFWVDERGVPPTDPQSNYKLAKEHLIDPAGFPENNVHRIQAELEQKTAARLYADEIRKFFGLQANEFPQFDIIHRGMGPDAHTASLFPGEPFIDDHENLAAAVYVEKFHQWRITLLPGVLEAARNTIMLVAGGDKAEPLRTVLHEPYDPKKYPVQIATEDGRNVLWFLDEAAARLLN
jgi:6-phosphogluconolactonase